MNKYKTLGISFIRTSLVPPVAGFILTWFTNHKIMHIHTEWVYSATTLLLSGIWYVGFRAVEIISTKPLVKKWAGIFIGHPTEPIYIKETK